MIGQHERMIGQHEMTIGQHVVTIGRQEKTIGRQEKTIQTLVRLATESEGLLDMRQASMELQTEVSHDFLKTRKKFGDLTEEQRGELERITPAIFRIVNFFGVEGHNVVHHRRTVTAAKLKEYMLTAPLKVTFTAEEVDTFLHYFNRVLQRKNPSLDLFKQEITLGTDDPRKR